MSICTKIVVGVDGSAGGLTAVRYAASEAVRTGLPLEVVYVLPEPSAIAAGMDPIYPLNVAEMRHAGRQILDQAERAAADFPLVGGPRLTLAQGDPATVLRTYTHRGSSLVLGNERRPLAERLITGSVLNSVAGRGDGPVTIVPDTWTGADPHRRVTVGIARTEESAGLLWRAFRQAAERDSNLTVLHAWELRIRYGQLTVKDDDLRKWEREIADALRDELESCSREFPDVRYRVQARNQQPALALAHATKDSDLMLIARRHRAGRSTHLGSTGRALLQATHCPVRVVEPAGDPIWERDAELEREGAILATRS